VFGIFLVRNELRIFHKIKLGYHCLQDKYWKYVLNNPALSIGASYFSDKEYDDNIKYINNQIKKQNTNQIKVLPTSFDIYANVYMILLSLLSIGNLLFIMFVWDPQLVAFDNLPSYFMI